MNFSYRAPKRTHNKTKQTQILKLERLANHQSRRQELGPVGLERWVVNLTDRILTPAQEDVLKISYFPYWRSCKVQHTALTDIALVSNPHS